MTRRARRALCSFDLPPADWLALPDASGEVLIGAGDRVFGWIAQTTDTFELSPLAHPEPDRPGNRFNDGRLGPDGRYWAGTMDDAETRATGSLYAFTPDGEYAVLDTGYRVPNGPAFSPDGTIVYHSDSALGEVYAFDLLPDGSLGAKRVFARFERHEGCPDGMTTDADGNLWAAMWDGARIEKLSPEGERIGSIPIPTRRPTSCVFVDPDCTEMYVTSASVGLGRDDRLAGGLFRVRLS